MFVLISDIAACEAHNNGKLTVYLPTRPLNYNVKYSYHLAFCTKTFVCSIYKIKLKRICECVITEIIQCVVSKWWMLGGGGGRLGRWKD